MPKHLRWQDVQVEKLSPTLERQMITGERVMLARLLLRKGNVVPEHSHHNEQITNVLEGALKFWIDGKELVVLGGEVLCIPPNMPHKVLALEDTIAIDTFNPPRQDWLDGDDSYLRQKTTAGDQA
ncbi:MAG: cupin domain-containing protein [Candidatus Korobacteraceae bacterium]